jgi:hypothetical protein
MKKTFKIALPGGVQSDDIPYHPIIFIRGSDVWRLALHREPVLAGKGNWIVSDPVSGYRVCRVSATYKGLPVASRDLTIPQARAAALVDLDTVVDRVGLERFTRVLGEATAHIESLECDLRAARFVDRYERAYGGTD